MIDSRDRPRRERVVTCDGCRRRLRLRHAALIEDGAVLCAGCAATDVGADLARPTLD